MAQSESDISEYQQVENFSDLEVELNTIQSNNQTKNDDFEVGTPVCAISNPSVEGLIIGKSDTPAGHTEVILLIFGYKKKGHAPSFAMIIRKDIERFSKRRVGKYAFPLPQLEKWQACLRKNKKDLSWTTTAIQALNTENTDYLAEHNINSPSDDNRRKMILTTPAVVEEHTNDIVISSQADDHPKKRTSQGQEKSKQFDEFPLYSDSDTSGIETTSRDKGKRKKKNVKTKRLKSNQAIRKKSKRTKRSSSLSSSSSSKDTDSTDTDTTSSSQSNSSTRTKCPFSYKDIRGNSHIRARMKGKSEERKYIRCALHNLYSSFSSLKCVVNDIRARSLASGTRPLTFDLIWLEQHVIYLDTLMFESSRGVWKQWNEPVIDELALAFLELLVRVSPRREYSDRLDEKVRKWMKKKRIGLSQRYGPVPNYLQQAKITEAGIFANNNFLQRRWSSGQQERPSLNSNGYKPNFRLFSSTVNKQNGVQQPKPAVSTQV